MQKRLVDDAVTANGFLFHLFSCDMDLEQNPAIDKEFELIHLKDKGEYKSMNKQQHLGLQFEQSLKTGYESECTVHRVQTLPYCLPAAEQKLLHQWIPSRRRGKGEAGPQLGMRSAHLGSTEHNPASWSPTSYWKLEHDTKDVKLYHWLVINEKLLRGLSALYFASHSLLAIVFPSWPMEQIDISLSTLVTLALRPPSSPPPLPPPPSVFDSEDCCEAGPAWDCSPCKNTFGWPWILSAGGGGMKKKRQGQTEIGKKGNALIVQQSTGHNL